MCTYLKNMAGWKPKDLKNKSFDSIQKLFDKAMKRVNTFVAMDTKLVEGSEVTAEAEIAQESSSKRAGEDLQQESTKKQKIDDVKETAEVDEDKETKLVKAKHGYTRPEEDYKEYHEGRIVGIKRLLDDLRVTAAKLMLLVQKLLLLVLKVNVAGMKVTTAERLQLLEEFMLTEKRSKTYQRKNKD
ncbi:hypothetical protein Tco_0562015 [Tanacetum coccineum]